MLNAETTAGASTPRLITVGIAELAVCADPEATLITHALGSCVAVLAYDPARQQGGLLHYLLPSSKRSRAKALATPENYADTGIPALFRALYGLGSRKVDIVVTLVGGSRRLEDGGIFDTGRRNYLSARQVLGQNGVPIAAEDVGGTKPRTVRMTLLDGVITVSSQGDKRTL
jgi:chemotaxis protein CheD